MKVKVMKVESLDPQKPGRIKEGKIYEGNVLHLPVIGESFIVGGDNLLVTSTVVEILDNHHFKTRNSIYHFEIIKDDKANTVHPGGLGKSVSLGEDIPKRSGSGGDALDRLWESFEAFKEAGRKHFRVNV